MKLLERFEDLAKRAAESVIDTIDFVGDAVDTAFDVRRMGFAELTREAEQRLAPHIVRMTVRSVSPLEALELAMLIAGVYGSADTRASQFDALLSASYTSVSWLPRTPSPFVAATDFSPSGWLGVLLRKDDTALAVIRGTADLTDWVVNVGGLLMSEGPGFINRVYRDYAAVIAIKIMDLVESDSSLQRIVLTGHSMGGAIASLVHVMLANELGSSPSIRSITFGSPAIGAVYSHVKSATVRIRKATDYVPQSLGEDAHTGDECLLTDDGHLLYLEEIWASRCIQLLNYCKIVARCDGETLDHTGPLLWMLSMALRSTDLSEMVLGAKITRPPGNYTIQAEHSIESYVETLRRGATHSARPITV